MEWSEAEDIINDAWGTCEHRTAGYYKGRIPQQERKPSAHPGQMEQPMEQPTRDREIKCTRYNEDGTNATFTFTVDEQQAYQARNHSDPKSCAKHRKSAGYRDDANNGPCRKFMARTCENGDQSLVILDFYTVPTPPVDTSKASVRPV